MASTTTQQTMQPVDLVKLLLENPELLLATCDISRIEEYDELARSLLLIFEINKEELNLLQHTLKKEIISTSGGATLFRENSLATTMMSHFCKQLGNSYLKKVLGPIVEEVFTSGVSLELDPNKASADEIKQSQEQLLYLSKKLLLLIYKSERTLPNPLKAVFRYIAQEISQKFPTMKYQVIGGFYFLRFLCPALVSPERYSLIALPRDTEISFQARRSLVLLSKILQALANQVEFGEKESYMLGLNTFIKENQPQVCQLLDKFAQNENSGISFRSIVPSEDDKNRAFSTVFNVLNTRKNQIKDILKDKPQLYEKLLLILNGIPTNRTGSINLFVYRTNSNKPGILKNVGGIKTVELTKSASWSADITSTEVPSSPSRDAAILLLKELLFDEQQMKRRLKAELEETKSKLEAEAEMRVRLENMLAVLNDNIDREVENRVQQKIRRKRSTQK